MVFPYPLDLCEMGHKNNFVLTDHCNKSIVHSCYHPFSSFFISSFVLFAFFLLKNMKFMEVKKHVKKTAIKEHEWLSSSRFLVAQLLLRAEEAFYS